MYLIPADSKVFALSAVLILSTPLTLSAFTQRLNFFLSPSPVSLHPAEDCQQMFLHPVNVRCLLREYGSLEASPDSITATVVEIEGQTVTEVRHEGTVLLSCSDN